MRLEVRNNELRSHEVRRSDARLGLPYFIFGAKKESVPFRTAVQKEVIETKVSGPNLFTGDRLV